ncbi:transporter substrate-binding domain-containing protein [Pseudomonas sp. DWRC2-2]|uniref:transporter substrate-binding domain-containing protein n=1 Tax=Pseudomonas sp. DWRC2-2 TaxID=2804567 RepID=UPI003CF40FB8
MIKAIPTAIAAFSLVLPRHLSDGSCTMNIAQEKRNHPDVVTKASRFLAIGAASMLLVATLSLTSMANAASLAEIETRGALNVATEDSYYPFEFIKDGQSDGFHKDVLVELRKYAQFKVNQDIMPWTGLLAGITSGKYDAAITGAGVTEDRLGAFDFVAPVAPDISYYIKRADDDRIKKLSDLSGLTVGVQAGGAQLARLAQLDAKLKASGGSIGKIVQYQSYPEAYADLANRRLDYVVNSIVPANMLVKERPKVFAVGEPTSSMGYIAWPVAKGNKELLDYLTGFVDHLRDTGKLAELQKKWLGQSFDNLPHVEITSSEQLSQLTAK